MTDLRTTAAARTQGGDFARVVAGAPPSLDVAIGGHAAVVDFLPPHRWPRSVDLYTCLAITLDGVEGHLFVPPGLIALLHDEIAPGLSRKTLPPDMAGLLIETAAGSALDAFEAVAGCRIAIGGLVPRVDAIDHIAKVNFGFRLSIPGTPGYPLVGALPADWHDKLHTRWVRSQIGALKDAELVVRAGWTVLDEPFGSLEPDDVVVLSHTALNTDRVLVLIGDEVAAVAEVSGDSLVLEDSPAPIGTVFSHARSEGERSSAGSSVICDISREVIRIDDALALKAGSLIKLPHGLTGPVELRADTGGVALGRLVRVGSRLGVRLMERPRAVV